MLAASARRSIGLSFAIAASLATAATVLPDPGGAAAAEMRKMVVPLASAEEGKKLFVGKGCVVCHQVNGIGGKAAPALDADSEQPYFDVFEFAARMWRGAPTMILLQEMELGYQIELSGEDLANLAAFASDSQVQGTFSENDIPEVIRDWMVDEVYQELDPDNVAR
jgi:cytochrome c